MWAPACRVGLLPAGRREGFTRVAPMHSPLWLAALAAVAAADNCLTTTLEAADDYKFCWTVEGAGAAKTVHIDLDVASTGWIGFGISERSSGSMPGSDIVTLEYDAAKNDEPYLTDRYATAFLKPEADGCASDWSLGVVTTADGRVKARISRAWTVPDTVRDHSFYSGRVNIVVAKHVEKTVGYTPHTSSGRKVLSVAFEPEAGAAAAPDITHAFTVPFNNTRSERTLYANTAVDVADAVQGWTADTVVDLVGFRVVDDLANNVDVDLHHMVLYMCSTWDASFDDIRGKYLVRDSDKQNCVSVFAWAPATPPFSLPSDVGFRLGEGADQYRYMQFEAHFDNPKALSFNAAPSVIVELTRTLRTHEAQMVVMGDGQVLMGGTQIPIGRSEWQIDCPAACTSTWSGDVTAVSVMLHMHALGEASRLSHTRGGVRLADIETDEYYAFGGELFVALDPPRVLKPGDSFGLTCNYNNQGNSPAMFGPGSDDEMCMAFVMVYPKRAKNYCGHTVEDPRNPGVFGTFCGKNVAADYVLSQRENVRDIRDGPLFRKFGNGTGCPAPTTTSVPATPSPPRCDYECLVGVDVALSCPAGHRCAGDGCCERSNVTCATQMCGAGVPCVGVGEECKMTSDGLGACCVAGESAGSVVFVNVTSICMMLLAVAAAMFLE